MKTPITAPRSFLVALSLLVVPWAMADTVITSGTITTVSTPADLDLTGDIVYAINFSNDDPDLTVNGVVFTPDTNPPVDAVSSGHRT